ncbi:hypothetical protein TWF696_006121 [Orbilia brochopaga]|uniref:Uncharacterized protein n=1 Tax=Orbilia brochopaga TaxID=3140254 RepID=A0AAV9UYC6_9PEZI
MFSAGRRAYLRTASHSLRQLQICQSRRTVTRQLHSASQPSRRWIGRGAVAGGGALALLGGFIAYQTLAQPSLKLDAPAPTTEKKSKPRAKPTEITRFWDRPGVYMWGSNSGRVAAPESDEAFVKAPRRIAFFDGHLLRDIQMAADKGVAVTENGDIYQWGTAYTPDCRAPVLTFPGKDIVKVGLSEDRVVALSSSGKVYSIPFSKEEQEVFAKPTEYGKMPFSSWTSAVSYRNLTPQLGWWERIVDIGVGLEHTVMLTSKGRVFTAACASYQFPLKGQLGIADMSWKNRPKPYDTPLEVTELSKSKITQIAAGDYHSVVADKDGNIFSWGDNVKGQLGFEYLDGPVFQPTPLPPRTFYKGEDVKAKLCKIYAGGQNSFFTIDAEMPDPADAKKTIKSHDIFGCGYDVYGTIGAGIWVHAQPLPQKLKEVSGLTEFSEKHGMLMPITSSYMTVGNTHAAVIMDNLASVRRGWRQADPSFGNDIMFFGGNEFYQLGNGKRVNMNKPTYVPPLEPDIGSRTRNMEDRFQVVPERKVTIVDQNSRQRSVKIEQRIVAGRDLTACYARTC